MSISAHGTATAPRMRPPRADELSELPRYALGRIADVGRNALTIASLVSTYGPILK